jgi:DGQHR domain-containing protein
MSRGEANAVLRGQISWNEYAQTSLARKDLPKRIRSVSGSEASDLGVAELTAGALAQLVFVSDWRVTDHDSPSADRRGYQRPLAATRLSPIARYIAESDGRHLFPPIILSVRHVHARQRDEFLDLLRTGNIAGIHNRWGSNTVCAVDGQHRMGGALHAAMSDHPDLDRVYYSTMFYFVTEAKWFATINSTSKPVPRSLVEWTKVDITEAESVTPEQQIRRIAQRLADEGPWKDSVNFGGGYAAGRHITFEGLRRATHDMFGGVVPGTSHLPRFADPYMFACHFWEAVAEMWPEAWNAKPDAPEKYRLRELVGLAALAKACAWMIRHGINQGFVGPRLEDYVLERLGRLQSFRWLKTIDPRHSDVYDIGSGFAGQGPLAERLYQRSEARG